MFYGDSIRRVNLFNFELNKSIANSISATLNAQFFTSNLTYSCVMAIKR